MLPSSPITLLRQIPMFADGDERMLETLASHSHRKRYKAGASLFYEGEPGHTLYIILSGHVNIQTVTASGETVHIAQRGPGESIGELAMLNNRPRMADAVAADTCDVLMLHHDDLLRCLEKSPHLALRIMANLAERLQEAADQLKQLQKLDVLGRLAAQLLKMPAEDAPVGKRIVGSISQGELAQQIGTTRATLNKMLGRLEESKAIRREGREILILSERRLRQLSAI
ncbi:MAG TPA: Crp/Fnr family transcriptional regulator [Chthonomonadaceae bacterium]|nr:Crp/Fnr family transcriptional regulator [Chthonomonadaceae bacterium]